jgi:hypothetical protein
MTYGNPAHYVQSPKTDYDFNIDLWDFTNQLNDGHTRTSLFLGS